MPKTTASRAERGTAPPRILNDNADACPLLLLSPCNQRIAIEVAPGSLLSVSRGTAIRLGLDLIRAALKDCVVTDARSVLNLDDELIALRESVRALGARLCMVIPTDGPLQ